MTCFYCTRPTYAEGVCFSHYLRFVATVYGWAAVIAAVKENAPTAATVSA